MALNGSVSTNKYDGNVGLTCTWTATQDLNGNKSIISWKLASDGSADYSYWTGNVNLVINGSTVLYIPASERELVRGGGHWSKTGTCEIPHNSDGTKTFTIEISAGIWYYTSSNCTGSGTFTLDTIPRASSASVPNFTMGTAGTISINRANANFTHTLSVKLGGNTYQIASGVSTSYKWTPDLSEWGQRVPNATSASCTMILDTYNGSTKVGTAEYGFTLYVPTSAVPTISSLSVSLANDNATVKSWGIAVKGYTKLQWSAAASGASGSSIKGWAFTAGGLTGSSASGTTGIIQTTGSITPSIKVTDSRGRTTSETAEDITVYDYAAPNISNAAAYRCDADGNADEGGTNVRITLTAHISSVNGKNSATLQYRYKQAGGSFNGWTAFTSGAILPGFAADKSYEVELRAIDALGNSKAVSIPIPTESVWLHGKDGGKGAAFGKYAEEDDLFDVAWRSRFRGAVTFDTLPAQVAPSGYGLGTDWGRDITDANKALLNGIYVPNPPASTSNVVTTNQMHYGPIAVFRRGSNIMQKNYFRNNTVSRYSEDGGSTWSAWEWENPPMEVGVEYRTTKRMWGLPVYQCIVSLGAVGAGTHTFPVEHITRTARAVNIRVYNNEHEDVTDNGNVKVGLGRYDAGFAIAMDNAVAHGYLECYIEYCYV